MGIKVVLILRSHSPSGVYVSSRLHLNLIPSLSIVISETSTCVWIPSATTNSNNCFSYTNNNNGFPYLKYFLKL